MDFRKTPFLGFVALLAVMDWASAAPFDKQWALENTGQEVCNFRGRNCQVGTAGSDIKAKSAWAKSRSCAAVVTAVLDTGVDTRHPDLARNLMGGKNFVDEENSDDPTDDNLHGTHVSGIIAGGGSESGGVMGVCQRARVLPIKVAGAEGTLSDSDVLEGIQFAVSNGAKVVNASFGGGPYSSSVRAAISSAKNVLFVFAAGNGDRSGRGFNIDFQPVYPASYDLDNIIVVAATDNQDNLGRFSNFGARRVHLAAPGVNIVSTMPMAKTKPMQQFGIPTESGALDGTSMATPYVTGAVSLLWARYPSMQASEIKQRLLSAVDPIDGLKGKVQTGGRLNLARLF